MFRSSNFYKRLDEVTSSHRLDADWDIIMIINDLIRQNDVSAKDAINAISRKISNANSFTSYYALIVLESCVKNCGSLVHDEISTKSFMEQFRSIIENCIHDKVKTKALDLIQSWAFAFRNIPKYRAVNDCANIMKASGYKFPAFKESDAMFTVDNAPKREDGTVCHRCRTQFSLMTIKRHCCACGQVFCHDCSSHESTLPKYGIEKPVRVCDSCFEKNKCVNLPETVQMHRTPNLFSITSDTNADGQGTVPARMFRAQLEPPAAFSFIPHAWPKWKRRFERYRSASGLDKSDEPAQVNAFLYIMGDAAEDIYASFSWANAADAQKFSCVLAKFEAHFIARLNVIHERYLFNRRRQLPGESSDTFITALYTLSEHCMYGTMRDDLIRDHIVFGIRDANLSKNMQMVSDLTLAKAIRMVRTHKTVEREVQLQRTNQADPSFVDAVNHQHRRPPTPRAKEPQQQGWQTETKP